MSEELLQRGLLKNPEKIGNWDYYNIGATNLNTLKQHGIIEDIDYGNSSKKKPDGIIVSNKKVIAVIENKKPSELLTLKKQLKAIDQEIEVARKLKAKILIVTDTINNTYWINPYTSEEILNENGEVIKATFNPKDKEIAKLINKILLSVSEHNSKLIPLELVDPLPLAQKIWQDLWSVSGATPENCLYTFVELFIFKYLSDLGILKGIYNFQSFLEQYKTNGTEEVLELYANIVRKQIKALFPANEKDNTTIINGTIFVSKDEKAVKGYSTVFKKILERFRDAGNLENIHYDFKSKLFETFLKESISKKNWGQFFTPLKVVQAIVKMTEIKENMKICDPACGVGKFLLEPILKELSRFYKIDQNGNLLPQIELIGFDKGFDKDEQKTIILAKANMLIYLSNLLRDNAGISQQFSKLFNDTFLLKTNSILGTLSDPRENEFDLILTNPPYVTSGSSNLKEEIKKSGLEYYYSVNAMGVEGLFMEWIVRALKPGGKAFIIVPDGILNRLSDKKLRKFILDECFIDGIISLPPKTFFTTIKKTYILAITKKIDKIIIQTDPVFTYLVSEIGETLDTYRFDTNENHLDQAVILFNQFKGAKSNFTTTDNRCKIQPFELFDPENHWSVDRWWPEEEKIGLGIIEEKETMTLMDFNNYIGELSDTLLEYQETLKEISSKKKNSATCKSITLDDQNYFELFIGKRVLKRDLVNSKGNIPIYSANVKNPIGFLEKSNIENFENDFVIWGIDGDFEFNTVEKHTLFATTDHCGAIRIKDATISPFYIEYQLNQVKYKYGFDRGLRSSLKNMKAVEIEIPINEAGLFDPVKQKDIVDIFSIVQDLSRHITTTKTKIQNTTVELDFSDINFLEKTVQEIFDFALTNSKITQSFCMQNSGEIPVYGCSREGLAIGHIRDNLPKVRYYEDCISYNRNGHYSGRFFNRKGRFSTNEDHRVLELKQEFKGLIDLDYMKNVLEIAVKKLSSGFSNKLGNEKIKYIVLPIPINSAGEIDIDIQESMARKFELVKYIKNNLIAKLKGMNEIDIDYSS